MSDLGPYKSILASVRASWNEAEETIKLVEIAIGEPVRPSVQELRYAGRRIVEALDEICNGADEPSITKLLHDAEFDCLRARHDAIDAASSAITIIIERAPDQLDDDVVLEAFPEYGDLVVKLQNASGLIATSRKDRKNRNAVYKAVQNSDFPEILKLYRKFRACVPLMQRIAEKNRRQRRRDNIFGYGGLIFGALSLLAAIFYKT